jgi:hypothetical protein
MKKSLVFFIIFILVIIPASIACSKADSMITTSFGSSNTPDRAAFRLEFVTHPAGAVSGLSFTTQPVVAVKDAEGKVVTGYSLTVKIVITNVSGTANSKLGGTNTVNAVNGIATFKDLSIDLAGHNYMLTAISGDIKSAVSNTFEVTPGAPVMLIFSIEPVGAGATNFFSTSPAVAILDANRNVVVDSSAEVTLNITPGTGTEGAVLNGVTTVKAKNGIASFSYLSISLLGSRYTLTATSPGLKSTESKEFYILSANAK